MSRRLLSFLVAIGLFLPFAARAEATLSSGMNRFGSELLSRLVAEAGPNENVLVSPYSVSSALSMVMLGASGQTRTEIEAMLGMPDDWTLDQIRLGRSLASEDDVTLSVANGIWGAKDIKFRRAFTRQARRVFDASVDAVDFADKATLARINGWVSSATRGMIPNLIDSLDPDLAAVLVNALYFKGDWKDAFDPALTADEDFHFADGVVKPVSMMHKRTDFAYASTDGFQAVSLPYMGEGFDLVVVLPSEGQVPLDALKAALGESFEKHKGVLALPKVDISASSELAKPLEALGMKQAFEPSADFSAMCDRDVFVSRVIHKVAMKMDEKGTEAAAATAVMMMKTAFPMEDPPFRMIVNRPYGIALRHHGSGTILFMGIIANPA